LRFWDSSAVLPLALHEPTSERLELLLRRDPEVVLWWGTPIECASAFARARRQGTLRASAHRKAQAVLDELRAGAFEVQPAEEVRARAQRILAVHPLGPADAFQLAAALVWCRERTRDVGFVCLDDRLREAAARENFKVVPYSEEVHELDAEVG
jgi:uncharacterized protein